MCQYQAGMVSVTELWVLFSISHQSFKQIWSLSRRMLRSVKPCPRKTISSGFYLIFFRRLDQLELAKRWIFLDLRQFLYQNCASWKQKCWQILEFCKKFTWVLLNLPSFFSKSLSKKAWLLGGSSFTLVNVGNWRPLSLTISVIKQRGAELQKQAPLPLPCLGISNDQETRTSLDSSVVVRDGMVFQSTGMIVRHPRDLKKDSQRRNHGFGKRKFHQEVEIRENDTHWSYERLFGRWRPLILNKPFRF